MDTNHVDLTISNEDFFRDKQIRRYISSANYIKIFSTSVTLSILYTVTLSILYTVTLRILYTVTLSILYTVHCTVYSVQ